MAYYNYELHVTLFIIFARYLNPKSIKNKYLENSKIGHLHDRLYFNQTFFQHSARPEGPSGSAFRDLLHLCKNRETRLEMGVETRRPPSSTCWRRIPDLRSLQRCSCLCRTKCSGGSSTCLDAQIQTGWIVKSIFKRAISLDRQPCPYWLSCSQYWALIVCPWSWDNHCLCK